MVFASASAAIAIPPPERKRLCTVRSFRCGNRLHGFRCAGLDARLPIRIPDFAIHSELFASRRGDRLKERAIGPFHPHQEIRSKQSMLGSQ
jgi:hypothetical protein